MRTQLSARFGAAGGQCFSISMPTSRPTANRSVVNPLTGEPAGEKMVSSTPCEPFLFDSHDSKAPVQE